MRLDSLWILVAAFGLGSIPFGFLLYRWQRGGDIRTLGSGNIGATNVMRSAGRGLGIATLALDAAKGYLAVWLALRFAPGHWDLIAVAMLLAVAGHMFTPWLRFQGGKGVATALGAFLALAPVALLGALVVFLIVATLSRFVSLASVAASAALPLLLWLVYRRQFPPMLYAAAIAVAALVILRHHANLGRLVAGTESKLGRRPA